MIFTIIKRYRKYLSIKNSIKQANRLHALTKKRYYVLMVGNKLHVFDRNKIDFLVNEGILHQSLRNAIGIEKHALYFTGQPDVCKPKELRNKLENKKRRYKLKTSR